jgi:hypothetical protein
VQRRAELDAQLAALGERQRAERRELPALHREEGAALKTDYLASVRRVRLERARNAPRGLAAFLARVSGVALIRKKLQRYRDRQRYRRHLESKRQLAATQEAQWGALLWIHGLQARELERQARALSEVERRELRSLEVAALRERRVRTRARHTHLPAVKLDIVPPAKAARETAPVRKGSRKASRLSQELNKAARERLAGAFARAAEGDRTEGESGAGESHGDAPAPALEETIARRRRRKRRKEGRERNSKRPRQEAGKHGSSERERGERSERQRRQRKPRPPRNPGRGM